MTMRPETDPARTWRPDASARRSTLPTVSLITSLFRSGRHLEQFLTALQRTLDDLETGGVTAEAVIVANEPDLYERRLLTRALAVAGAPRLRVVSVGRESLYASWNRGVALAEGENVAFWNVDDLRNSAAIFEGIRLLTDEHQLVMFPHVLTQCRRPGVVRATATALFMDSEMLGRIDPRRDFVIGPFFVCTKSLVVATEGFDEQFRIVGDYDWQIRAAGVTAFLLGTSIGGLFQADGRNLSSAGSAHHWVEQNIVYRRHGMSERLWDLTPEQQELQRRYHVEFGPTLPARLAGPHPDSFPGAVSPAPASGPPPGLFDAMRGGGRMAQWFAQRGSAALVRRAHGAWIDSSAQLRRRTENR